MRILAKSLFRTCKDNNHKVSKNSALINSTKFKIKKKMFDHKHPTQVHSHWIYLPTKSLLYDPARVSKVQTTQQPNDLALKNKHRAFETFARNYFFICQQNKGELCSDPQLKCTSSLGWENPKLLRFFFIDLNPIRDGILKSKPN